MAKKLDAKDVELYLLENTDFFLSRESLVSELSFKHDAEGATSLLEMQVRKLRDEQLRLMNMLSSFVSTGKENEELFFKSKNLTLSLIASENFAEVKKTVELFFHENFMFKYFINIPLTNYVIIDIDNFFLGAKVCFLNIFICN